MKYKVGDEVLVKVRMHHIVNQETDMPYEVKAIDNKKDRPRTIWVSEQDIQEVPDMTAEEAWEIAKKLFADYSNVELDEIFGKGWSFPKLMELTPQKAKAKIEAWEAKKEIKVGDEVGHDGEIGVVTNTDDKAGFFNVLFKNGKTAAYKPERLKKTGRRIDITRLLNQIGGDK